MSSNNSRKKILFVTRPLSPPWDEASKNFAYDLACNTKDHDITILVDEIMDNVPSHITQKKIYTRNHLSFTQKMYLLRYLKRYSSEFDIVHLLFTPTKLNSWMMQKILHRRDALQCVSTAPPRTIQTIATLRDDLYSPTDLKKMFFGDVLITYSQWAREKMQKLGFTNAKQIYPGFNLSKYIPNRKDVALLNKWNITPEDKVVTYPGEFVRLGATDLIVDTFIALWKNPNNAHVKYLCNCRIKNNADAEKKQEVIERFTKAGHRDKVVFTDTVHDMSAVYNLSDIVIFPVANMAGKFDVPLAMVEPYACKKPVIASDLPLFREFSSDQINVIIPTANSDALATAITDLLDDQAKQKELGENAYKFAHDTFNIENIAQKYTDIYSSM